MKFKCQKVGKTACISQELIINFEYFLILRLAYEIFNVKCHQVNLETHCEI